MTPLRSTTIKVTLLLLCALALGVFAERRLVHEHIVYSMAPQNLLSDADLQQLQRRQACKARGGLCGYYLSSEGQELERQYIEPAKTFISGASVAGCLILLLVAGTVLVRALYSWLATRSRVAGMASGVNNLDALPGVASLRQRLRSWQAERRFLRYRRLYDSGLLSDAEFEAKKRELKPLIIGSL